MNHIAALEPWFQLPLPWRLLSGLAALALLVLLINFAMRWVLRLALRRRPPQRAAWSNALLSALGPPLRALVWLAGISLALQLAWFGGSAEPARVGMVRNVLAILVLAWFAFRFLHRIEHNLQARRTQGGHMLDPTAADAVGKLARGVVVLGAALALMQALGLSITALLAFGGAAGIAVGFAAQSLVANLFGGLTVFATRIFRIGEDIIIPASDLSGTVQHIGWRSTQVLGWDHRPFFIPNSVFNTSIIINYTRMRDRRINEFVYLRYEDIERIPAVVEAGNAMLGAHPQIDHDYWVFRFDSYGSSALQLFLEAYVKSTSYAEFMRVKEDVLLKLAAIVREQGAELALPVSVVRMPDGLAVRGPIAPAG